MMVSLPAPYDTRNLYRLTRSRSSPTDEDGLHLMVSGGSNQLLVWHAPQNQGV
jgi:hypothetical protein